MCRAAALTLSEHPLHGHCALFGFDEPKPLHDLVDGSSARLEGESQVAAMFLCPVHGPEVATRFACKLRREPPWCLHGGGSSMVRGKYAMMRRMPVPPGNGRRRQCDAQHGAALSKHMLMHQKKLVY